jgi:hypothetical protein
MEVGESPNWGCSAKGKNDITKRETKNSGKNKELMTIFYCLKTLGVVQPNKSP